MGKQVSGWKLWIDKCMGRWMGGYIDSWQKDGWMEG